ncbi:F-box protein [Striga hermonthica]|uniref:F-box protein n=1 Tax=Striga hermonthica TaxID=68872 RepID=A0A9N7RBY8_STRHE|nr:F-box protein [Striga hermonthica]
MMARRRRGEFFFAEPIIHRIQYFLNGKEAAQTTVLSKSWRQAWLNRPNLDFDICYFSSVDKFLKLMGKAIQRYEESNLNIESFSLTMDMLNNSCENLIIKALGMGVPRLSLQLSAAPSCSVVPAEVFGCKDLVKLSLTGGKIALAPEHQVHLPRLKSLSLSCVRLESDEVISGLLSGCSLLEKLSLALLFDVTISILPNLPKLRHLELRHLTINTSFLGDLSCKFPLLRELSIHHCSFQGDYLLISCPTIECLNITNRFAKTASVEFDVPSIRKFKFRSWENLPSSLTFKSTSFREWESHLSITSHCCVGNLGVIGLNKLLTSLGQSKIHLRIEVVDIHSFNYDVWEFNGLKLHKVEELTIDGMHSNILSLTSFALFNGLFRLCRPKFITQQNKTPSPSDFLFKMFLRHGINHECSARSLCMYALRHLEEVRAQIFDLDVDTWRFIPMDTWDALKDQKKIRFQLMWRDESQQVN